MSKNIRKEEYFALIDDEGYILHTGNIDKLLELKNPGTSIAKVTEHVDKGGQKMEQVIVEQKTFNTEIKPGSVIQVSDSENSFYAIVLKVGLLNIYYVRTNSDGFIIDKTIKLEDVIQGDININLIRLRR